MNLFRGSDMAHTREFGIVVARVSEQLSRSNCKMPMGLMKCVIKAGQQSLQHSHVDHEVFVFLSGRGVVRGATIEIPVGPGDVVQISSDESHYVTNSDDREDLAFLSIYWIQPDS
jgi:mannose-6-phosphate isomerase-like protein (cupin superfamily)